jgi:HD-like signal output (HDOD) protein
MRKRILLVGKDQVLWREWRSHHPASSDPETVWSAEFAASGAEAFTLTNQSKFDAIVADIYLPDMTGVELLDQIMDRHPRALRIVMSDIADMPGTVKCIGKAHRHLLKPLDVPTLINALNDAVALEAWMPSETVQKLMTQMRRIPSPPNIYFEVIAELRSANASVEKIADLIAQDPAITAKLLQLANSAVFGLHLQIVRPVEAIAYLGLETSATLMLLAHTFSSFAQLELSGFSVDALWRHSVLTGQLARRIAQSENATSEAMDQAFTAGLLHDIGKLLVGANLPDAFGQVLTLARRINCSTWEAENQLIPGGSHAELGGCVLGIWKLPRPVVEAVALHHCPGRLIENAFSPLTAVHVANVLAHQALPQDSSTAPAKIDMDYLQDLGLDQRLEDWQARCSDMEDVGVS